MPGPSQPGAIVKSRTVSTGDVASESEYNKLSSFLLSPASSSPGQPPQPCFLAYFETTLPQSFRGIQVIVIQVDRTGSRVAGPKPPIRRTTRLLFETACCGGSCRETEAARAHALRELPFDLSDCLHCLSHETIDPIKCIFRSRLLIHLGKNKREAPLGC